MKLLQIYNQYRSLCGGEETVVHRTAALVEKHGGRTTLIMRSSRGLENSLTGKFRAACSGIYNADAYREITEAIRRDRPDVVHAHNLYPLFSPSVLVACRRAAVPVVLSLHNHMLTCPNVDHLYHGQICERCTGGSEYWCMVRNCRRNFLESTAYAARSMVARKLRLFHNNVTLFVALTKFAKQRLIDAGFDARKICVLPNMVDVDSQPVDPADGQYVAFAGRLSREKGIETLLAAATRMPDVPVRLAGDGPLLDCLTEQAPASTTLLGRLNGQSMTAFYRGARFVVLPSTCFEMCPLVVSEAMSHGLPVVASRIGGNPELVDDGATGLLFEPGNAADLADKIWTLWNDPELCRRLGRAGREKAVRQYGEEVYYRRLTEIYDRAIEIVERRVGVRTRLAAELARRDAFTWPRKVDLFGVKLTPTTYDEATEVILDAAGRSVPGIVTCQAVHGLIDASSDPAFREKSNAFDMIVPDGQPVRWAMNLLHRTNLADRVYGPELMLRLCRRAAEQNVSIYLYGSFPEVIDSLQTKLTAMFPKLRIAGTESPPFRPLSAEEDAEMVRRINRSGAGIVFVALGCPKQDLFAYEHRSNINAVQVCVGAAFDFHTGVKKTAPGWMQRSGLEWLFRLVQEPGRLWRRYLVTNTVFLAKLTTALLRQHC